MVYSERISAAYLEAVKKKSMKVSLDISEKSMIVLFYKNETVKDIKPWCYMRNSFLMGLIIEKKG